MEALGKINAGAKRFFERLGSRYLWDEAPAPAAPLGRYRPATISEHLPYRAWDEIKSLYQQERWIKGPAGRPKLIQSVGFILEVTPLQGGDETTSRILGDLFNDKMPPNAVIQVVSWASPKTGPWLDRWAHARADGAPVYRALAKSRRDYLMGGSWRSLSTRGEFLTRDFRVFISVEIPGSTQSPGVQALTECREGLIGGFASIGSSAETVKPDSLISIVHGMLNPTTSIQPEAPRYDDKNDINDQIVESDTTLTRYRDRLVIKARRRGDGLEDDAPTRELEGKDESFDVRTFYVQQYPTVCHQGWMSKALGDLFNDQLRLSGPTLASLCFVPMSVEKTKGSVEFKRIRTDQQASGPFARFTPQIRKTADDWAMVAEEVAEGARLGHLGLFVTSYAPLGEGEKIERQLRSVYQNARFVLRRCDYAHLETLMACLPMGLGCGLQDDLVKMRRLRRMTSRNAANLSPLQGETLGYAIPHLLLVGRRGQPLFWSPFGNTDGGNHNVSVIGSSGSGKSVLMQEIAMSLRSAGAFVTIVDDGFSFQNSCILQGGAFIRFSLDLDVCINPFGLVDHAYEGDDRQEVMAEARNNVTLMVLQAARGENDITPEERGVVEQAVGEVWEELGSDGSIEAVAKVLEARHGERGVNLAISLSAFRVGGVYGRFFNGRANLDISNPLTVFEMSDLETKKDLRSVVIMAILALVRKRMKSGGRALKKALIIDEAWQLLGGGMTGAFIEGFARRCRKEGGALITGTQSLNDYYKTSGAQACIENSDWSVVLRLKEEALEQLRTNDRLSVDENQLQMLKSLRTSDGEFSELMVKGPHGSFCARLVLDPFSATLFSTKPDVFAAVDTLKRRGVSMDEAIRRVAAGARGEPEVVDGAELMRLERLLRADPDLRELAGAWGRMGLGGRRRLFTAAREVGPEMEEAA